MTPQAPPSIRARIAGFWQYVPGGALLFAIIPLLVLSYAGWFYYGAEHLDKALYSVTAEHLSVTPQPEWIEANVIDEVFRNARLDRISLLDPKSNATLAQAFEAHPWIRSTTRVTKAVGGKVAVDVVYRRPVAMVYCQPQPLSDPATADSLSRPGFFPIDAEGVMLPVEDFSEAQVWEYFLIIADGARPAGDIGMAFGDARISDALRVCEFLEAERRPLQLQCVFVEHDNRSTSPSPWVITLETKDKHQIRWGHRPKAEAVGESSASDKLKAMTAWLEAQRRAQTIAGRLDLSSPGGISSVSSGQ